MDGWMGGWMDGWMDGQMDEWMDGQIDRWIDRQIDYIKNTELSKYIWLLKYTETPYTINWSPCRIF